MPAAALEGAAALLLSLLTTCWHPAALAFTPGVVLTPRVRVPATVPVRAPRPSQSPGPDTFAATHTVSVDTQQADRTSAFGSLTSLEQPVPAAAKIVEEWANVAALEDKVALLRQRSYLAVARSGLEVMRTAIEAGAHVRVFALATPGDPGDIHAIAMVRYEVLADPSGQLAERARLKGLAARGGAGAVAAMEVVAVSANPTADQDGWGTRPQLVRWIDNWAATKDCLLVLGPKATRGMRTMEFELVQDHHVYIGSRWVSPEFEMVRLGYAFDVREEQGPEEDRGRLGEGEQRLREEALRIVDNWMRIAATPEARFVEARQFNSTRVLIPAARNLRAIRVAIEDRAPVHVFALTTDGGVGGIESIAMVRPIVFDDHTQQLAIVAREKGLALQEGASRVAAVEILAYVVKPAKKSPRGVRQQLIRRMSVWAAARHMLLTFSPKGELGKSFAYHMPCETIKGHEPYQVFTGSGWELSMYNMIKLM